MGALSNLTFGGFVMAGLSLLTIFLAGFPILTLVMNSLTVEKDGAAFFSFQNYAALLRNPRVAAGVVNTLIVALGTAALASFAGVTLAWINARTNSAAKRFLEPLNLIPFYLSPLILAVGWMFLASPRMGLINKFFVNTLGFGAPPFDIYSMPGIIWVMGISFTPYMYLFTIGSLQKMDPALEDSARTTGASMLRTTLTITIPLATPSILFGFLLTFITSAGLFSVPAVLGVPAQIGTLPVLVYEAIENSKGSFSLASATGMILFVLTVFLIFAQRWLIAGRDYTTVTGKGYRPSVVDLGRWRWAAFGFNLLYLAAGVFLPLGVLFLVSISNSWHGHFDPSRVTLANYAWVLFEFPLTRDAIQNSLFLSAVGATVAVGLSLVISYVLVRQSGRFRDVLDFFVNLPVSVPGIVFAMGILVAYIKTPIYGTIWIMMLAYVTRYLPVSTRNTMAVMLSVSEELEQSSRMCGATWLRTLVRVSWPLIKAGALAAWLTLFLIYMRELNSSILLFSEGNEVMSIALYVILQDSPLPHVAAYSFIQCALVLAAVTLFRRWMGTGELGGGGSAT
ncbi:MAG: iron ABC transporter permease [Nitrospinota bacterium]